MKIEHSPESLKRLQHPPGKHQRTFATPLDRLPVFVAALLAGSPPLASGIVTIRSVVFEPKHLEALLRSADLPTEVTSGTAITGSGTAELHALLGAALADWLDFYFVPRPARFVLYADHDEYTTVFGARKGPLSRIAEAMSLAGVTDIAGYSREL